MSTLRQKIISTLIIAATVAVLIFSLTFSKLAESYDVAVGEVCPTDIYASRSIVDTVTTASRKKAAENAVADVYVTDSSATETAAEEAREFLSTLYSVRSEITDVSKFELLKGSSNLELSDDDLNKALSLTDYQYQLISSVPNYIEDIMSGGVTDTDSALVEFNSIVESRGFTGNLRSLAESIAKCVIRVNKTLNTEATEKARAEAAAAVADVTYMKNQIIVRRGEVVSEAEYAMLNELGYIKGQSTFDIFHSVGYILMLLLAVFAAVMYYMFGCGRYITASPVAVTIICSASALIGAALSYFGTSESVPRLIYLMPFTLCPALIALLLDLNLAMVVNFTVAVTAAVHTDDYVVGFIIALSGVVTSVAFSKVRRRGQLLSATLVSALFTAVIYAASYFDSSSSVYDIAEVAVLGLVGALFGGVLTIGTIPFWEAIFDVITPMKLGELSNPEHKLLRKLLLKAPGSYHHSLTVANMAEAAASAIGANSLLARVGAYYHDIGKIQNPMYFKENQLGILNPHDTMNPKESAEIIIRHVKDGVALAESYRLPAAVRDIIAQHHGTTTAAYFLHKARTEDPDCDAAPYTYPGPIPVTREATIIMLADACEAAVRAMHEHGDIDARETVEKIVNGRIADGQLKASALSFADLEKVKDSFAKTLDQYFHKRIIYPQNEVKSEEKSDD